jgi:hypothetical protein
MSFAVPQKSLSGTFRWIPVLGVDGKETFISVD